MVCAGEAAAGSMVHLDAPFFARRWGARSSPWRCACRGRAFSQPLEEAVAPVPSLLFAATIEVNGARQRACCCESHRSNAAAIVCGARTTRGVTTWQWDACSLSVSLICVMPDLWPLQTAKSIKKRASWHSASWHFECKALQERRAHPIQPPQCAKPEGDWVCHKAFVDAAHRIAQPPCTTLSCAVTKLLLRE